MTVRILTNDCMSVFLRHDADSNVVHLPCCSVSVRFLRQGLTLWSPLPFARCLEEVRNGDTILVTENLCGPSYVFRENNLVLKCENVRIVSKEIRDLVVFDTSRTSRVDLVLELAGDSELVWREGDTEVVWREQE